MRNRLRFGVLVALSIFLPTVASAQKYAGVIDKTVAVVGNEMITLSQIEEEVQVARAQGMGSDRDYRCEILETLVVNKLLLMQAHLDSLSVSSDLVESQLTQRLDQILTSLGGEEQAEEYFGKPLNKLRSEWRTQLEEMTLIQQEEMQVAENVEEKTPADIQKYVQETDEDDLPIVPAKYQMSHICIYPDREAANLAVKEKLLDIRERILAGEKFATLARIYSEDPGSARKGGELGMASKSIFWPVFADAAMSLKPGLISQIVETPDGFHIIEVLEKKGDMFNARHILMKPQYTVEDRERAFNTLDSLKTEIEVGAVSFELAAQFYSEDPASRTNGGQMADPNTGSSYFEIDQMKPQDYRAVQNLKEGEISNPIESLDNEGRDGNLVYKIVRLDKILPAHPATFENDYQLLSEILTQEEQEKVVNEFVSKKIKETNILLDPLFKDCDFEHESLAEKFTD